ncbi:endonuclease/exonuclease/phosphatase family protein [Planomicrobium okeanokoites]|uniref:endonuclease/exonuclease/phosphatase family protein n=1 Tax=Planomicrobium okeanokoites TaxID=244 RepID=UPI00248F8713|nr:endonuclease/exonuclease/phosphatase family protein [Planomicrobium okeanokoites]
MGNADVALRIMSFNISSGLTMDGRLNLELTASVIENAEVDIASLQEVDQNFSERTDFTDQVKWLAKRLGMHATFGPNLTAHPADAKWPLQAYGNAILSRHPIKSYQNHLLKKLEEGPESEQRGLLEATIEINDEAIAFFNTHLSLNEKQLERNIEELLGIIRNQDLPAVLTGDFNAEPNSPHMKRIEEELDNVFGAPASHPETYKKEGDHGQKIDFIFYSRHWQVLEAETIDTEASDHRPILAVLELYPKA